MRQDTENYYQEDAKHGAKPVSAPWQLPNFPWHSFCAKPLRILLADKNASMVRTVEEFLQKSGHKPFTACDADIAMEIFLKEDITIVVADLHIEPINGLMLLRKIRGTGKEAGVIIVTDDRKPSIPLKVFREGADDFLLKPFSFITLMDAIERCHNMFEEERLFQTVM